MKVEEIKKLMPEAEVYSLDPEANYIITFKKQCVHPDAVPKLVESLGKMGIKALAISYNANGGNDPISLYEVKE